MEQLAPSPAAQAATIAADVPSFACPSLLFENQTSFSATQFDAIDQHDAAFHIIVVKAGYTIGACDGTGQATLKALEEPVRLNTEDIHYEGDTTASVLEESDYAPYKPRCDVTVNAVAYAPAGKAARSFHGSLSVTTQTTSGAAYQTLIDKSLSICGPRWFIKKHGVQRLTESVVRTATVGMLRPSPWRLSQPQPISHLPVRYEYALGGQCRIDSNSPAAKKVPLKHRLTRDSQGQASAAIAHEACESNPVGRGFTRDWFLKAESASRIPAPQLSMQGQDFRARDFAEGAHGCTLRPPAGFGAVGRAWLPRRALVGKIEEKSAWASDEVPRLPTDFDYAYWNCAPTDQQCDHLSGPTEFTLVNLCSHDNQSARADQHGNTVLRFVLPEQAMCVLALTQNSELTVLPLSLDTVVVTPGANRVDIVWRGHLIADGTYSTARLMRIEEPGQIERMNELLREQSARTANQEQESI